MVNRTIKGLGVKYYLWGDDPVQAMGEVLQREFYFRASCGDWEIQVADRQGLGVLPSATGENCYVQRGNWAEPGPLNHDKAAALIEAFIRDYAAACD